MREEMSEPSVSPPTIWLPRLQRLRVRFKRAIPFTLGVLAILSAIFFYDLGLPDTEPLTTNEVNELVVQAMASATPPPAFSSRVYQAILPSLVFIQTQFQNTESGEEDFGVGSGVVISTEGDILTSLHVVDGATDIQIIFTDGTEASAQVVVAQPENDIAVLQPSQLPSLLVPAILGNPNAMRVGDEAFVVGNPLGLFGSMTAGVISGFDRSFTPQNSEQRLSGLIQFDAAVNPGNSGGPLLNRYGQVIGIVTALANPTEQDVFIGIGFAVPINTAGGAAGLPPY
jgi:S1-C subfamily serine protease